MAKTDSVLNFEGEDFGFTQSVIKIINEKEKVFLSASKNLEQSIPFIEKKIADAVIKKVKQMNTVSGNLLFDKNNIDDINKIEQIILEILLKELNSPLNIYVSNFETIQNLNIGIHNVLNDINATELQKLVNPIQKEFVKKVILNMTDSGLNSVFIKPIKESLFKNILSGGGIATLENAIVDLILSKKTKSSNLFRYITQISTDAINQFDGAINDKIKKDFGLNAYKYVGSIIETSRPQCKRWVGKKILRDRYLTNEISWANSNGSGMIAGTTKENFTINRGGYSCRHQAIPFLLTPRLEKKYFAT